MSTMLCAVILLASTPGAAGLVHPGPTAAVDPMGDGLKGTVLPSITGGSDAELAVDWSRPLVVDMVCRSYERPPQYQSQLLGRGEGAGAGPSVTLGFNRRAKLNASSRSSGSAEPDDDPQVDKRKLRLLGKEMKTACFGSTWNRTGCYLAVNAIRNSTWPSLIAATQGDSYFKHLPLHWEAPYVKQFSQGGGVTADIPCRPSQWGKAHLYYRHIFKDGGKAIEKNLAVLSNSPTEHFIDGRWWEDGLCEEYHAAQSTMSPKPVLFTFVREPMAKFIAGFKEIASRGLIDDIRGSEVGTVEHAKLFLDNVLHGSCDNGHVLLQIQNMFGPACESQFDYIGRLENFSSHWQELGEIAGCETHMNWPQDWGHASDNDDKSAGAEAALRAALAEGGGKLASALCVWLLPDYIAFDYPLPEECKARADLMQIAGSF